MKIFLLIAILFLITIAIFKFPSFVDQEITTGAPPYDPEGGYVSPNEDFSWLDGWTRPDGPPKVALQVGHWKNDEVPQELHRLKGNTGATGGGKTEWEVNYEIAQGTKELLEKKGIKVELLPATVPPRYWADVFVSIHADGSLDPLKSGFKIASPRRDYTGKATNLVKSLETAYEKATDFEKDDNITRNMRGYYAFSWWRYEHAVHPMTTSAILETGFLTNPNDRTIIVEEPEISSEGLAKGIISFLENENLLKSSE